MTHERPTAETPTTNGRRIGPHLALGGGLLKAAARAEEIGATAVQIFTDNPTAWRRRGAPPAELAGFRARLRAAGIGTLAVHAPYLVNLCGANDDFWRKSIATMANELRVGSLYGADFVVMHIGSHRGVGREVGIDRLVIGLAAVLDEVAAGGATDAARAAPCAGERCGNGRRYRRQHRGPGRHLRRRCGSCAAPRPARRLSRYCAPVGRWIRHLGRAGRGDARRTRR